MSNNRNQAFWLFFQFCLAALFVGFFSPGLGFIIFMVGLILYVSY